MFCVYDIVQHNFQHKNTSLHSAYLSGAVTTLRVSSVHAPDTHRVRPIINILQ